MITQLSIQGLAIIDTLDIGFAPGFNVITGETGAGKSILIRALGFLTGAKASADAVRSGWESATVAGEFIVPKNHPSLTQMAELGLPVEDGDLVTLLLRRQIHKTGRSHAWINDVPVATTSLKSLGTLLVDVFAQHENQRLLNPNAHIEYVDSFLDQPALRENVRELGKRAWEQVSALSAQLLALEDGRKQSDYLTFRYQELEKFSPSPEDYAEVRAYCDQAETARKSRDPVAAALALLEGQDDRVSPLDVGRELVKALGASSALESYKERAAGCLRELDDLSYELGKLLSTMEFDETRLEESTQRLFGYQELFRKHAAKDIEGLVGQTEALKAQLAAIHSASDRLEDGLDTLLKTAKALKQACEKLTIARLQAAQTIKSEVERELHELQMPGSVFQAEFAPTARPLPDLAFEGLDPALSKKWASVRALAEGLSDHGAERAQFFLSANPGEPPMPLSKTASGGELSRIMLALKKALAADAETCVLVFDEIDSGISGRVADVVGRKMKELCASFQVICISHLPQVAVYADLHLLVAKTGKSDRTQSSIVPLSKEESAREIARLISGKEVSSSSLAHAKSLIAAAHSARRGKLSQKTPISSALR